MRKILNLARLTAANDMRKILVLAATVSLAGILTKPGFATDVLILGPTVNGGTSSLEATTALGLSLTVKVVSNLGWPSEPYASYKAIVLGDASSSSCPTNPGPVAAAENNSAAWAAAVTGNVVIIGTDPTLHQSSGGAQLWKSAIQFAAAGPGTGAVIALSCYYHNAPSGTVVNVLNGFGTFKTQGVSADSVNIVAFSPALTGLSNATLSNWGNSVHEGFTVWDPSFMPLAIATDSSVPPIFTAADGSKGFPYILARGVTPISDGRLKVCKVAGPGVAVGTSFSFTAGSSTFTVPAGPAPGGTCALGPSFPVGTLVTVDEIVPAGDIVSSITVAPPGQLVGTPDLAGGSVNVTIGSGVTEVTYTDKSTGFLEICKRGDVTGNFTFYLNPGGLGPFVVPAGGCSPAIEVPAGSVVIHEMPVPGLTMIGCATIPASQQGPCNLAIQNSTVTVAPGDISTQTIAFITNRRSHDHDHETGEATDHH